MRFAMVVASLFAATTSLQAQASGRQADSAPDERHPGSAVVTVGDSEYLIRVECRVRGRPEAGFTTEPNRITREQTNRSNMVTLRLRPWQDTKDVIVSLDGFVAWMPTPGSSAGVLRLELAMSPTSVMRDGSLVALTYDMWQRGDRPPGRDGVKVAVNCLTRDPSAPAFRKVG